MKKSIPLLVAAIVFLILPAFVTDDYILLACINILLFAYLATAWNIVGGFAGQLSFGHSAFMAIGGYVSSLLFIHAGLTPWIGMLIGGIISAIVAVLIGIPTFKLKGAYYAIATIAFSGGLLTILNTVKHIGKIDLGASEGIVIPYKSDATFLDFQFVDKLPYYYIIFVFLAVILLVAWYIDRSKLGFYLTALREDEEAAKALGINTARVKLYAAAISGFFTGIGGTFFGQLTMYLLPDTVAGPGLSSQMVFLSIVGGIGTVFGPFVGSIFLTTIGEITRVTLGDTIPGLHLVIYGIIVAFVILFYPKGIAEPLQNLLLKGKERKGFDERTLTNQRSQ
ncbi:branched-chain amino acid ABC transporter permease [Effusibacillus dendaii]|uniref:Branched-chain amino acid ABC transporter permease n=1 Tax=Effusibacillus dendaii TaxID=2743772 RepID=A0A7I8D804_9BACL|nr:branched-chain amino acid ABC transporter permease [Effusibacillus dendaii]BCJ86278.1 branched-chain amino acid ABC transporter permease [Effusibacillus dendaii]